MKKTNKTTSFWARCFTRTLGCAKAKGDPTNFPNHLGYMDPLAKHFRHFRCELQFENVELNLTSRLSEKVESYSPLFHLKGDLEVHQYFIVLKWGASYRNQTSKSTNISPGHRNQLAIHSPFQTGFSPAIWV